MATNIEIKTHVVLALPTERPLEKGHIYDVKQPNGDLIRYVVDSAGETVFQRGIKNDEQDRLERLNTTQLSKLEGLKTQSEIDQSITDATWATITESMPAIQGGSTSATATVLPTLGSSNKWFEASWGYWKYNNVVLTNPNGVQGIPEGSEGVLFWNGTTQTWNISKVQVLPKGKDGASLSIIWDAAKVGGYSKDEKVRDVDGNTYISTKNANTSALTVINDWIDSKENRTFIFNDTKYQRASGNWGLLQLEIWDEQADLSKDYHIRGFGVRTSDNVFYFNIFSNDMVSGNLYGIAGSGLGNISGGDYTGVKTFPIYRSGNANVEVGSLTVDFSKIRTSGSYNNTSMYGTLNKEIFKLYKVRGINAGVNPYPLSDKIINYNTYYKPLRNISIFDPSADLSFSYYVLDFKLNTWNESQQKYLHYFIIARSDSAGGSDFLYTIAPSAATVSYIATDSIVTGVKRYPIYKKGTANVGAGYIDVDFNLYTPVTYTTIGSMSKSAIDQKVFTPTRLYNPVTALTHRLILPNDIYFLDDEPLPIFKQSVFSSSLDIDTINLYQGRIDGDRPMYNHVPHSGIIDPKALGTSLRISAKYNEFKSINTVSYYKDLAVNKVNSSQLSGKTSTVIGAGDSITDFLLIWNVARKLNAKNILLSYQGTMIDNSGGLVVNNEGRSSWEYRHAIGKASKRFNETVPIVPQSTGATSDIGKNPFLYPATPLQILNNPTWCFENHAISGGAGLDNEKNYTQSQSAGGYSGDYYTFDFERYAANHSITIGDKLIFISNWGFNDVNHLATQQGVEDALLGIEIVVNRLKDYAVSNPTKQVFCGISGLLTVNVNLLWNTLFSNYLERAIVLVKSLKSLESSNFKLDFIPVIMSVDRSFSWNYPVNASTTISTENDTKYSTPSDVVHPGDVGVNQISNVLMAYIANRTK